MAGENIISTTDGLMKEVVGDLNTVVPASAVLTKLISFDDSNKTGDSYHSPIIMTLENGATYNGNAGTVVTLKDAKAAVIKDATLSGSEMIMRSRMGYTVASRAAGEGKQAVQKAWTMILENLRRASVKRLELQLLYGQRGLGVVSGTPSANVITISDATWSPATFAGLEGAKLEGWTTADATSTQRVGSSIDLTIVSVQRSAKTITVTQDGDLADGDTLFFEGAKTATGYNEMVGLTKISSNLSTDTLFGITGYGLFAGNTSSSFGTPTMGKFLNAITEQVDAGLEEEVELGVCPKTWEVLNSDLAANREFDGSYSKELAENGTQKIRYYGQNGRITVHSMPYLRRGDAVIFPKSKFKRIGSADIGMGVPGTDGRDVFFHLEDKNAVECRTFMDQALFCEAPAQCCLVTGITYP